MKKIKTPLLFILCLIITPQFNKTFSQNIKYEKQVDKLFKAWDSDKTPGATVAVVKDGKIIYKKGYGMANLEYDIPNRPDTIFHIASVSKQFTTFAILLLEKDGKLSLDDDIRKYIPEVPDFGKKITLRHLAHHTSGLRDQWALIAMAGGRLDDVITTEHILKLVKRQKELNFAPGEQYMYSNTGYTLLAEVVKRVSGKSFAEFTKEKMFKPLKMENTIFYDDHEKIVRNRAYSYRPFGKSYKKSVLNYANVGATSLFTTVEDLSLWAINFEKPIVGDLALIKKMKQRGVLNNGSTISYALGQSVGNFRGANFISHSGGDAGYRTYLGRFPDKKFSVIVFSNDGGFNAPRMARSVMEVFLNDEFAKNTKTNIAQKAVNKTPATSKAPFIINEKTLNDYIGSYELAPTFIIKITQENGTLIGQATGQPKLSLKPITSSKFAVVGVPAEVSFHRNDEGKITLLKLKQGGASRDAKRIQLFSPKSIKLSDYTGYFYSKELATGYEFVLENGKLVAKHSRLSNIPMSLTKKDYFAANSWFFGQIEFIRNDKDLIIGCKVSNGRVRNLLFEKK